MKSGRRRFLVGGVAVAATWFGLRGMADGLETFMSPASLDHVDPELLPFARAAARGSPGVLTDAMLPSLRQGMERFATPMEPGVAWAERQVPGLAGQPPVRVFVINADRPGARPGIVHLHGGGFMSGSARMSVGAMQRLAHELDCVVVTVDYRLAPETRWDGIVADAYAALKWLHGNAAVLGVDPARLAVTGESAGGGLAALLAIAARDRGEVPLAFQSLIYPMLDDRTGSTRKVAEGIGELVWTAGANRFGWRSFLGRAPGGADVPAAAVPARCPSLTGLPPAFIAVGGIDLFVAEDTAYARRLQRDGVAAELLVIPGAFHGFDVVAPDTGPARRLAAARLASLRRALG